MSNSTSSDLFQLLLDRLDSMDTLLGTAERKVQHSFDAAKDTVLMVQNNMYVIRVTSVRLKDVRWTLKVICML